MKYMKKARKVYELIHLKINHKYCDQRKHVLRLGNRFVKYTEKDLSN